MCGEYGLRGVSCAGVNWNNGLGMPNEWSCNIPGQIASATGWSNFLTFEGDRNSAMVSDSFCPNRPSSHTRFLSVQCADFSECSPDQRQTHVVCGYEY